PRGGRGAATVRAAPGGEAQDSAILWPLRSLLAAPRLRAARARGAVQDSRERTAGSGGAPRIGSTSAELCLVTRAQIRTARSGGRERPIGHRGQLSGTLAVHRCFRLPEACPPICAC